MASLFFPRHSLAAQPPQRPLYSLTLSDSLSLCIHITMATSEGGFVGVISLRSADQVEAMSNAIRRLVHHSVAIFPAVLEEASVIAPAAPASAGGHYPLFAAGASRAASASRVAQMAAELGADARTIADLAATFPPLCIEPATSQRALQVVTSLLETVRVRSASTNSPRVVC